MYLSKPVLRFLLCGLVSGCSVFSGDETNLSVTAKPNVSQCLPRGSVHVVSANPTGSVVEREPNILSRALEKAIPLGGDTVVAAGPLDSGGQFFDVYRCRDLQRVEPPVIGVEIEKAV